MILPFFLVKGFILVLQQVDFCLWIFHIMSASFRVIGLSRLVFIRYVVAAIAEHIIAIWGRMVVIMFFTLCIFVLHGYNMSVLDIYPISYLE